MNLWFHIRRKDGPTIRIFIPEIVIWSACYLLLMLPLEYLVARALFSPRRWRRIPLLARVPEVIESARGLEVEVADAESDFLLAFRS